MCPGARNAAQEEQAIQLQRIQADRERENRLRKERRDLTKRAKLENVERQRRREEYLRMQTLAKLHERDEKMRDMLSKKAALVEQRRDIAIQTKRRREAIVKAMDEAKITKNWDSAGKKIAEAMTATSPGKSKSSAGKLRASGRVSSLPNLRGADDGELEAAEAEHSAAARKFERKAEQAAALRRTGSAAPAAGSADAFKSPYELASMEAGRSTKKAGGGDSGGAAPVAAFAHLEDA